MSTKDASSPPGLVTAYECSSTNNIPTPSYLVGESCIVDGKIYSQGDYNQLRRSNIDAFEEKYMMVLNDNNILNEYQRHQQLAYYE